MHRSKSRRDALETTAKTVSRFDQYAQIPDIEVNAPVMPQQSQLLFYVACCAESISLFRHFSDDVKAGEKPGISALQTARRWDSIAFRRTL